MTRLFTYALLLFSPYLLLSQTISRPQYVAGHALVKFKNEYPAIQLNLPNQAAISQTLNRLPNEQLRAVLETALRHQVYAISNPFKTRSEELDRTYLFLLKENGDLDAFLRELSPNPLVDYAEKEPMYYPDYLPNDYVQNTQYYINKLQVPDAWDITKGDTNVVIAIVDNAVSTTHPDLAPNMFKNWAEISGQTGVDDDNNGFIDDFSGWDAGDSDNNPNPPQVNNFDHGTHVAGCASAAADNGLGIAGIGFNCRILPIKAKTNASASGGGLDATLAGFDYAVASRHADIINMSFGGQVFSQTFQNIVNVAHSKNIVVVAAAGNDNVLSDTFYPASLEHVISVAASNFNDQKSWFSNYGSKIDVTAPGSAIRSTIVTGINPPSYSYASWDGTSMASPVACGVIGLMRSVNPNLSADAIESCLKQSCDNINALNSAYIGQLGAGRINAYKALSCLNPTAAPLADFSYQIVDSCGGKVAFQNLSQNLVSIQTWDLGSGQFAAAFNPVVNYSSTGTYTVKLIVGNPIGYDTISKTVNVVSYPIPVVQAGPDLSACYGQPLTLSGSSNLSGAPVWTPNIGLSNSISLTTTLTPTQSAGYILTVTTPNGCKGRDTVAVNVHVTPTVYAGADKTLNPGDSTQLNAISGNNVTYQWLPTTGLSNPNIKNPIAKPAVTTYYTLTVTNTEGCSNNDGVMVYVNGTTGIDEQNNPQILPAYPNPVQDEVFLRALLPVGQALSIQLMDNLGRQLGNYDSDKINESNFEHVWDVRDLPAGIYWVKWQAGKHIWVQQIVKE